jgi:ABC-2 type transport system ATP-binding protein
MTSAAVTIDHVSHSYADRPALVDLSLSVAPAEIFGFLGPNGSGKTTLFRILSTLIPPQQGRVTIMGFDVAAQRDDVRKQIGVVFQSPSLDKQLTARENLIHHGHLFGLRGRELHERVEMLLSRVSLGERANEYVGKFSGGMRRRVELAKGLLNRPRVLLLDEPSTGLDPGARIDLWRYLREIRDTDGITVLMTTHLMEEADHCDRLAILDRGKLVAADTPAALKDQIGGDVIQLTTSNSSANELRDALRTRLNLDAQLFSPRELRLERRRGHELVPQIIETFPGMIDSVTIGKPTLEDVFIHLTGRGLDEREVER